MLSMVEIYPHDHPHPELPDFALHPEAGGDQDGGGGDHPHPELPVLPGDQDGGGGDHPHPELPDLALHPEAGGDHVGGGGDHPHPELPDIAAHPELGLHAGGGGFHVGGGGGFHAHAELPDNSTSCGSGSALGFGSAFASTPGEPNVKYRITRIRVLLTISVINESTVQQQCFFYS